MKRHVKLSVFLLVLLAALVTAGCSLGDDDNGGPGYTDNPLTGSLTAATAAKIFDYTEKADGVTIDKFKDADELEAYLNLAPRGAKDLATTRFVIGTINRKPVVAIGAGAFDESEGAAALPDELADIKLPETIKDVGSGAFKITSVTISLLIPETVLTILTENDPAILYEIVVDCSIPIKEVTAESEEGEELDTTPPQAYKIVMADMTNGTITASPKSGVENVEITLTVSPDTGWRLEENGLRVFYGEVPGTAVTLTAGENNVYTFTLPASDVTVSAEFEEGPIQINSQADMAKIGTQADYPSNGKYELAADITLSNWTPLGTGDAPFSGVFDGAGHTITMTENMSSVSGGTAFGPDDDNDGNADPYSLRAAGLFGVTGGADIRNLTVRWNGSALSYSFFEWLGAGVVVGFAKDTRFTRVMVTGETFSVTASLIGYVGGFAGMTEGGGGILQCGSTVDVNVTAQTEGNFIGGLVGTNIDEITESFASGNVSTTNCEAIGGLVGNSNLSISDSYAAGSVSVSGSIEDSYFAAGLTGQVEADDGDVITISNSYARGNISVTADGQINQVKMAGIAANVAIQGGGSGTISGCAALNGSLQLANTNGLSDSQLYIHRVMGDSDPSLTLSNNIANSAMTGPVTVTFTDKTANGRDGADVSVPPNKSDFTALGWDFTPGSGIWKMGGDGYPVLQWQP
ncbi:MAG: hypothetical protein LBQ57_09385 [Spirochaetales bacterium]|nr:hypothetical protein [Spirochaetales bacterium]